jgi:hypothetical protein
VHFDVKRFSSSDIEVAYFKLHAIHKGKYDLLTIFKVRESRKTGDKHLSITND